MFPYKIYVFYKEIFDLKIKNLKINRNNGATVIF